MQAQNGSRLLRFILQRSQFILFFFYFFSVMFHGMTSNTRVHKLLVFRVILVPITTGPSCYAGLEGRADLGTRMV